MLQLFSTVFKRLKLDDVKIRVNHRKVLNKIADHIGLKNDFNEFLVVLDKIDKIGIDKVKDELKSKFTKLKGLDKLFELISKKVSPKIYLENLRDNYLISLVRIY